MFGCIYLLVFYCISCFLHDNLLLVLIIKFVYEGHYAKVKVTGAKMSIAAI